MQKWEYKQLTMAWMPETLVLEDGNQTKLAGNLGAYQ